MARIWRHRRAIAAALAALAGLVLAPAFAEDQGPNAGTDLYDRPVLAVDPGMHTAQIRSLAVDSAGRYAVTGGQDRTVRIWSVADGKLLRTIWIPVGPDPVGAIYAVALSPDGSTIAAGGRTDRNEGDHPIYLFDRESGTTMGRIPGATQVVAFLTFSPDGRYLAAMLGGNGGLRVFDRDKDWSEAFRDDYNGVSVGAAFSLDGRLATTSLGSGGTIRMYNSRFRLIAGPVKAPSGDKPFRTAFSPNGRLLAVGYAGVTAVDLFDGRSLHHLPGPNPTNLVANLSGLDQVAWSRDGRTLLAAGEALDDGRPVLLAWDEAGRGKERRFTYCAPHSATGVDGLPDGRILVASTTPCLGVMDSKGRAVWTAPSPLADFVDRPNLLAISADGKVVDFAFGDDGKSQLRFDARSLLLSHGPSSDGETFPPNREALKVENWRNGSSPTLNGKALLTEQYDISRSLAIAPNGKRFFLASSDALAAFDDAGVTKWRRQARDEVWAVNVSKDGRIVVAAYGDGTIRWLRADDGRELLALQVLPNKTDWVLWTPEGFYEATLGAQDVLKWVTNHGADSAASTLPVSAIPRLRRPDALPLVLQELETARALGIADVAAARLAVQTATGSAKPPGGVLHVLAIGLDHFGDKAGGLHLDYAAEDAHDVANALLESQKGAPGKPSLYADVSVQYLPNDRAGHTAILDALDAMARGMRTSGPDQDVAVILVSSHGEMIDGQFYLS